MSRQPWITLVAAAPIIAVTAQHAQAAPVPPGVVGAALYFLFLVFELPAMLIEGVVYTARLDMSLGQAFKTAILASLVGYVIRGCLGSFLLGILPQPVVLTVSLLLQLSGEIPMVFLLNPGYVDRPRLLRYVIITNVVLYILLVVPQLWMVSRLG